jgi:hypothetical protein
MDIKTSTSSIARPSKIYPIVIFGLKIYHLAALISSMYILCRLAISEPNLKDVQSCIHNAFKVSRIKVNVKLHM